MYKHILIATDGSELANKAIEHGLEVAKRNSASVSIVTGRNHGRLLRWPNKRVNIDPIRSVSLRRLPRTRQNASSIMRLKSAEASGVAAEAVHVKDQYPAEGIIATARDKQCDLIVLASHGRRGLPRVLLEAKPMRC